VPGCNYSRGTSLGSYVSNASSGQVKAELTQVLVGLQVVGVQKMPRNSLHAVEYTHVSCGTRKAIGPRICPFTAAHILEAYAFGVGH
jgi:hypothetical protein